MKRLICMFSVAAVVAMISSPGCDAPKKVPASEKIKLRETIGKTTQRIYELQGELAKGAVLTDLQIEATDPLSQAAQAHVKLSGRLGIMAIQQALEMYNITNNGYPKTFDEFMTNIVKVGQADGYQLPERPFYQEYAYDVENHKLVIVEYPEKNKKFDEQTRQERGIGKLPGQQ